MFSGNMKESCEPEVDTIKGKKKKRELKWTTLFSTKTRLHANTTR